MAHAQGNRVLGEPPVYRFMPKGDYAKKGLCQKGTMVCQKGTMPKRDYGMPNDSMPNRGCQITYAKRGLCQITAQPGGRG